MTRVKAGKVFTLLVALMLVFMTLAACANNEGGKATNNQATSEGDDANNQQETPKETPTVKLNMTIWGAAVTDKKTKYYDQVLAEINKKLEIDKGFRIEPNVITIPTDQYAPKVNTMLAGGDEVDMIRNNTPITPFIDKQAAMDITDILNEHGQNLLKLYPQNVWDQVSKNGRIYGVPFLSFPYFTAAIARGDWMEKAGVGIPATLSEFETMLVKLKEAGAEVPLMPTMFIPSAGGYLENFLYPLFTTHPGDFVDDAGNIQPKYLDPGYKQFIELLLKWNKEGLVDKSLFNSAESVGTSLMTQDKLGVWVDNMWQMQFGQINSMVKTRPETKLTYIPALSDMKSYPSGGAVSDNLIIPANSKNAEYVIKYLDWFLTNEENYFLVSQGIKGTTYNVDNGILSIPAGEEANLVDTYKGKQLSGPFEPNAYILKYNTMYKGASDFPEYDKVNKAYSAFDLSKVYVSPVATLGVALSDKANLAKSNANKVVDKQLMNMITGAEPISNWDSMIEAWKEAGGDLEYQEYTEAYKAKK